MKYIILIRLYEMSNKNAFHIMVQQKLRIVQKEIEP